MQGTSTNNVWYFSYCAIYYIFLHSVFYIYNTRKLLYVFQGFPAEFAMYLNYTRGLRFEESPDYMYLRQLFRILFRTLNHQYDYTFDWTMLKQKVASGTVGGGVSTAGAGLSQGAQGAQGQGQGQGQAPTQANTQSGAIKSLGFDYL